MTAYYNEHDPYAAQWLRNLIAAGEIAPGDVDERDIRDVQPHQLFSYNQVHLCAGIGIWSGALRACGWSDDRPVWTASLPCQPFSAAGRGAGFADERHLWPAAFHLIGVCQPLMVLGEQSPSPVGLRWLELVQADMEGAGYALGAVITPAAGFGEAPGRGHHIRHRQYFCAARGLADSNFAGLERWSVGGNGAGERPLGARGMARRLGDAESNGRFRWAHDGDGGRRECASRQTGEAGVDVIPTIEPDGTFVYRPVEIGTFPLAHADSRRVGKLRAYGNALDLEQAKAFVRAVMELRPA